MRTQPILIIPLTKSWSDSAREASAYARAKGRNSSTPEESKARAVMREQIKKDALDDRQKGALDDAQKHGLTVRESKKFGPVKYSDGSGPGGVRASLEHPQHGMINMLVLDTGGIHLKHSGGSSGSGLSFKEAFNELKAQKRYFDKQAAQPPKAPRPALSPEAERRKYRREYLESGGPLRDLK